MSTIVINSKAITSKIKKMLKNETDTKSYGNAFIDIFNDNILSEMEKKGDVSTKNRVVIDLGPSIDTADLIMILFSKYDSNPELSGDLKRMGGDIDDAQMFDEETFKDSDFVQNVDNLPVFAISDLVFLVSDKNHGAPVEEFSDQVEAVKSVKLPFKLSISSKKGLRVMAKPKENKNKKRTINIPKIKGSDERLAAYEERKAKEKEQEELQEARMARASAV